MNTVAKRLADEIRRGGPIPFNRFMEAALYSPGMGYYERESGVIGRTGDYYTNISVGRLFGELLSFQFMEWLDELQPQSVQLLETGAHDGRLAADILASLGRKWPGLLDRLAYWIIEPSPTRQAWQRQTLAPFSGRVRWFEHWAALPKDAVRGIVFSNEFFDALPIRRLGWDATAQEWFEWGVDHRAGQFLWTQLPLLGRGDLDQQFAEAGIHLPPEVQAVLPNGFTVELRPMASLGWKQAAAVLRCGHLLAIDYGATAQDLFAPGRRQGTLRAYRRHHLSPDPLADPGEQDLTASVNFTQLQLAGESAGLRTEGFFSQEEFLTRIVARLGNSGQTTLECSPDQLRQFKTLTHPEHLGRAFKVLIQSRPLQETQHCSS